MSEPIPEATPTSADPRSRRPIKRLRTGANTATASQADEIEALMWDPSRPITLAPSSTELKARDALAPPPEIVANVQGSSAGAGSGEFHVYKASRRREYDRLKTMDEEAKKEEDDKTWEQKEKEKREKDEEKTRKNREKRNRKKKGKGGGGPSAANAGNGTGSKSETQNDECGKSNGIKQGLSVPKRERESSIASAEDTGNADTAIENGITIHDDD